jgi:hypothetical protein
MTVALQRARPSSVVPELKVAVTAAAPLATPPKRTAWPQLGAST